MRPWPALGLALAGNIGLQQLALLMAPGAGRFEWPPWLAPVGTILGDPTGPVVAAIALLSGIGAYLLLRVLRTAAPFGAVIAPFAVLAAALLVLFGVVDLITAAAPAALLAVQVPSGSRAPIVRLGMLLAGLALSILVLIAIIRAIRRRTSAALWRVSVAVLASNAVISAALLPLVALPSESFGVASGSMFPALQTGDLALVNRWVPLWRTPARGEVVVTRTPDGTAWIYRVMALPGERIALRAGIVHVNGTALPQTPAGTAIDTHNLLPMLVRLFREAAPEGATWTIARTGSQGAPETVAELRVPDGHLFTLGDNRDNSMDSRMREVGVIPIAAVQGPVYRRITARVDAPPLTARAAN